MLNFRGVTAGTYKSPMLILIFQTSMILLHVNLQGFIGLGFAMFYWKVKVAIPCSSSAKMAR